MASGGTASPSSALDFLVLQVQGKDDDLGHREFILTGSMSQSKSQAVFLAVTVTVSPGCDDGDLGTHLQDETGTLHFLGPLHSSFLRSVCCHSN